MKVSVVFLTFNRAPILHHALESVIRQTHTDWEMVIVDNGSTDNTETICKKYTKTDPRITYIKIPPVYYSWARNEGITRTTGELLAFKDDDNIWDEHFMEELVRPHNALDVAVSYCGHWFYPNINMYKFRLEDLKNRTRHLVPLIPFTGSTEAMNSNVDVGDYIIKRSVFKDDFQGFPEIKDRVNYCSDMVLLDQIIKYNPMMKFVMVPKRLHHYLSHEKSMTQEKLRNRNKGIWNLEEKWVF